MLLVDSICVSGCMCSLKMVVIHLCQFVCSRLVYCLKLYWSSWTRISFLKLSCLGTRFQNLGEMMTLGRNDAAISPSFIEGLTLEGAIGHAGKFFVHWFLSISSCMSTCSSIFSFNQFYITSARKIAYLIRLPTDEHRFKVGLSWFAKSAIDSVATVQSTITKVLSGS